MNSKEYQPHIDGLRAIAVLAVILFHLDIDLFQGGFVGVDIFFVISGYLITRQICDDLDNVRGFSIKLFYIRRFKRIFPALYCVSFLSLVAGAFILSPYYYTQLGGAGLYALFGASNLYFWSLSDYFDDSTDKNALLHSWSLGIEEQFYLIWPFVLLLLYKLHWQRKTNWALFLLLILSIYLCMMLSTSENNSVIGGLLASLIEERGTINTLFYLLPFRLFEFTIGGILVSIPKNESRDVVSSALFILGSSLIVYPVLFYDSSMLFPGLSAISPCLGTAILIYCGSRGVYSRLLNNKYLVKIGLISYSLYLVHWPLIAFSKYLYRELSLINTLVILVMTFILAKLLYHKIEVPFRHTSTGDSCSIKKTLFAFTIIFSLSSSVYLSNGFVWRISLPSEFSNISSSEDFTRQQFGGQGFTKTGRASGNEEPDIVLIGDSHARHLLHGIIDEFTIPYGLSIDIYANISCIHLPSFTRISNDADYDTLCPAELESALKVIKSSQKQPLVIISQSWLSQFGRAGILKEEKNSQYTPLIYKDLVGAIEQLASLVYPSNLLIIGQVPKGVKDNIFDLVMRPGWFSVNIEKYRKIKQPPSIMLFNRKLEASVSKIRNAYFYNPFLALCDGKGCAIIEDDNSLIYSDSSHLSKVGSRRLIRGMKEDLLQIMKIESP